MRSFSRAASVFLSAQMTLWAFVRSRMVVPASGGRVGEIVGEKEREKAVASL